MPFPDDFEAPFPSEPEPLTVTEAQAALALGRLDGALAHCPEPAMRIFAGLMLQGTLIAALRQEGHAFTEQRFHAWFAGLTTLSDETPRLARPPRALCDAILTELGHSSWEPLASLALRMQPALLAPQDILGEDAHEEALGVISDARQLLDTLAAEQSPLPLASLARLHLAVGRSIRFAPAERSSAPIPQVALGGGPMRGPMTGRPLTIERAPSPSPRWAIELLFGEHWRAAGIVRFALPWPGLIRLDALRHDNDDPAAAPIIRAATLRDLAQALFGKLAHAAKVTARIAGPMPGRRATSRAPALFELLAGFGPLRSAQLESLLGATRLGVRSMLDTLDVMGVLEGTKVGGALLYSVSRADRPVYILSGPTDGFAFSSDALSEFDASMDNIEQLLARSGTDLADAEE